MQQGRWKKKQLVPRAWVAEATRPSARNPAYGYMWWLVLKPRVFRADGWQGQAVVVLPARQLVIVRMREPSEGNTAEENEKYGFQDLVKLATRL